MAIDRTAPATGGETHPPAAKSVVEVEIGVPRDRVVELFTRPELIPEWMDDVARYEPVSGEPGTPGSQYRLVPRSGSMEFVATVLELNLPGEVRMRLDGSSATVLVTARFSALPSCRTRLVSEETFWFAGLFGTLFGPLALGVIRDAHHRHMEAFRRFAESRAPVPSAEFPPRDTTT